MKRSTIAWLLVLAIAGTAALVELAGEIERGRLERELSRWGTTEPE